MTLPTQKPVPLHKPHPAVTVANIPVRVTPVPSALMDKMVNFVCDRCFGGTSWTFDDCQTAPEMPTCRNCRKEISQKVFYEAIESFKKENKKG